MKEIRDGCNSCGGPHPSSECDDKPMGGPKKEEANYTYGGVDFKRWQKKMHFLLSDISVVYVLTTPMPEDRGDNPTVKQVRKMAKWDNDDYVFSQRIEESPLGAQDSKPKGNNVASPSVVNMVEHNNSSMYNDNKGKRKHYDTRADPNKKQKGSVDASSNTQKGQNMFNKSFQVYYDTYVSETYYMQDDDVARWVDSGATVHMCKDRCWFKTYESLNNGSILYMGNKSKALVHGFGFVDLRYYLRNDCPQTPQQMKTYPEQPQCFIDVRQLKDLPDPKLKTKVKEVIELHLCLDMLSIPSTFSNRTPMDISKKLMPNNGQAISQLEYSRVIDCLMYVITCTRPDIAFVVSKLSRYTNNPGTQYWQAIQRVLKYLKKTMDYRLTYTGYPLVLEGHTDAS
ncbi:hypothetical protein Tco_0516827 [Tanacetum coccineum]